MASAECSCSISVTLRWRAPANARLLRDGKARADLAESKVLLPETNPLSNKQNLQWTRDGRAIYYIALNNGVSNIWRQPVDGSPPGQVTQFTTGRSFNFSYSADGKQLALSRGSLDSDVVLIKDFE